MWNRISAWLTIISTSACPPPAEWTCSLMCGGESCGFHRAWPGKTWKSWPTLTGRFPGTFSSLCPSRWGLLLCASCSKGKTQQFALCCTEQTGSQWLDDLQALISAVVLQNSSWLEYVLSTVLHRGSTPGSYCHTGTEGIVVFLSHLFSFLPPGLSPHPLVDVWGWRIEYELGLPPPQSWSHFTPKGADTQHR